MVSRWIPLGQGNAADPSTFSARIKRLFKQPPVENLMSMKYFLSLVMIWLGAFQLSTTCGATTNILFLAGERSHKSGEHEFNAGCQLLAKALNEQSGLDVHATVINGWPEDNAKLTSFSHGQP